MSVQIKKKDIAILRSFGVSRKGIRNIFLFEGLLNGIKGTSWGFLLGLAIYFVQKYFQVYKLDSSKYILDAMPVSISFWDLPAIVLMSVFLSFVSSYYPAKKASLTNIIESIKWE
jgi:lipoprotein-releasing system permease protein